MGCEVVNGVLKGCCRGASVSAAVLLCMCVSVPTPPPPPLPTQTTQACTRRCNQHPGATGPLPTSVDPAARIFFVTYTLARALSPATVQSSLASGIVDVCLIPEVHFELGGERGLLAYLEGVLARKGHAVVCVAEGAGQVCGWVGVCVCVGYVIGRPGAQGPRGGVRGGGGPAVGCGRVQGNGLVVAPGRLSCSPHGRWCCSCRAAATAMPLNLPEIRPDKKCHYTAQPRPSSLEVFHGDVAGPCTAFSRPQTPRCPVPMAGE